MAHLLVQILKKFRSGAKHSDFGIEVESVEADKNRKVYKTLSLPQVGVGMGISKKVYLL
jgi:hypothetical protein